MINKNSIVRKFGREMNNDYYQVLEIIDKDAWMKDAVVCPYLAEEMIEKEYLEYYEDSSKGVRSMCDMYVNIVEAFDKVWVFLHQYGDSVSTVHINKDGSVWGSSYGVPSLDLRDGRYYAGDEISYMGEKEPFETDQSWLWNSVEIDCKTKCFGISKESVKEFIELRKDYLKEQAEKV